MSGWRRRIHGSWFIAWAAGGVIAGTALALFLSAALFLSYDWLLIAASLLLLVFLRRSWPMVALALAAGLLIGLWRGANQRAALLNYEPYYNQTLTLRGYVSDDADYGPHGDQRLRLKRVVIDQTRLPGTVWVSSDSATGAKRGDVVTVSGRLMKGFGNLPAAIYQARILSVERLHPGDIGRRLRDWFAEGVRRAIPEPQASLGNGYLLGQRRNLPEDLNNELRIVGLTHVIVASGYNLMILVTFARRALAKRSKYLATLAGGAMIGGFILITGFSPSMSRAGLVSGLGLLAWYYGRTIHPLVLLPLAAAVTLLIQPAYIWGDIGWYLSFAAFAGVLILAPLIEHFFWGKTKKASNLRQVFVATLAAQVATMPIIMLAFGQYSIYALPANLLVLPLIPLAMLLIFLAGLVGVLLPFLAGIAGAPASAVLHYMTAVVGWIANRPGAQGELTFSLWALAASYLGLGLVIVWLWQRTKHNFRLDQAA